MHRLYDEKHRLRYFSIEDLISGKPPSLPQSGAHEGDFCKDCDNRRLGQHLKDYAKKAIYGGGQLLWKNVLIVSSTQMMLRAFW